MKKILIPVFILILSACSSDSPEAIEKQIIAQKDRISKYQQKVEELEQKLNSMDTTLERSNATLVRIKALGPERFEHHLRIAGKVEAVEEVFVSPEMSGQIKTIHVKEGQRVNKGDLLVSLNTDVTQASINEVETNLQLMTTLYNKQKELWDQNIGSEVQFLQAKTNKEAAEARLATLKEQLDMAQIRAPFSGIIEDIMLKEGELGMPGSRILHMVDLKHLKITANVSESYLNSVRKGEIADISFPATPDFNVELPVTRVGSVIENMSRTFQVEIKMENPKEQIKPNQLADIQLLEFSSDEAMVVPSIIIKQDITGYYLYIVNEKDGVSTARKKYVEPGLSSGDQTMVNEGLSKGMRVIVDGYNIVKDGVEVKVVD
jgi:RND family efflux transporter MFP subunit